MLICCWRRFFWQIISKIFFSHLFCISNDFKCNKFYLFFSIKCYVLLKNFVKKIVEYYLNEYVIELVNNTAKKQPKDCHWSDSLCKWKVIFYVITVQIDPWEEQNIVKPPQNNRTSKHQRPPRSEKQNLLKDNQFF